MRPIRTLTVRPALPADLTRLEELAHNLWWCWNQDAVELFERIDRDLWTRSGRNPVRLLGAADQARLQELAADDGFKAHLERVLARFDQYMRAERTWWSHRPGQRLAGVGYFSFEFGIHECLPLYSGGMGLLAGDHMRSASDLGLPFFGISLLYQEGYFRQYLNADGWQLERYYENDFHTMPLRLERGQDGRPLRIAVEYPGRTCQAQVWRIQVGRAPLFLLDANLPENDPVDRPVTRRLYQGDVDMRIRQEVLLGIGGVRTLAALGIEPTICHMNEGHAAFLAVERVRRLMVARGLSFHEARELAAAGHVFTTHTPVPAGIDIFTPDLIDRYFAPTYGELGISREEFLGLGRQNPFDANETFSMAVLAIRMADKVNGVSQLHGDVSRRMFRAVWPEVPEDEVPIGAITNGVHAPFWTAGSEVAPVFDRYLGPGWREQPEDPEVWQEAYQIPSEELWRAHERNRERLVAFVRDRLRRQGIDRGAAPSEVAHAGDLLDPSALTIGFARRFATYKRALLMFKDADRLAQIMGDRTRRVQFVIAGKAHPQDLQGREVIRDLIHRARREEFASRIVFVENYDIEVARQMVQGVDLWLTNPRRPLEASGTSGMKVALNGGLNVSVLDGWWVEAYRPELGWAIGRGEEYEDLEYQDQIESRALYDLLEKEIVPLFYDRGPDDLPRGWIGRMKASIANIGPFFNTDRMVQEYATTAYLPCAERVAHLSADGAGPARDLAAWKRRMWASWGDVRVVAVDTPPAEELSVGAEVPVTATVQLGPLTPRDVQVELYAGAVDGAGEIVPDTRVVLSPGGPASDGALRFSGTLRLEASGKRGYTVRVLPRHDALAARMEPGLIRWAVPGGWG
jgi:starch phosphorylase